MDKALIEKEFDKLETITKDQVEKKKYKTDSKFLATYIHQAMISIENIFITLNDEVEKLKEN